MKKLALALIVIAIPLLAQRGVFYSFAQLDATGQTESISVADGRYYRMNHTFQMDVTGGPSTCTANVQGSLDNTLWFDLSGNQDCSTDLMFHIVNKPVLYVRINLSALTGGSSPTLDVKYAGAVD